jgi:hypothetical protein
MRGYQHMFWQQRKLPADDAAREFSVTALGFADTFVQYVASTQGAASASVGEARRVEACALIVAAVQATFTASAFTREETAKVVPLVRDSLVESWHTPGADNVQFSLRVRERSDTYLRHQDSLSQLKTATRFMMELVANLDAEARELLPVRTLTALLAHRMLSDVRRLNELKSGFSIG